MGTFDPPEVDRVLLTHLCQSVWEVSVCGRPDTGFRHRHVRPFPFPSPEFHDSACLQLDPCNAPRPRIRLDSRSGVVAMLRHRLIHGVFRLLQLRVVSCCISMFA